MKLVGSAPDGVPVLSYVGSSAGSVVGGIRGEKGDKGDTGNTGSTGATGATGPVGPIGLTGNAATATVGSTSTGLPGSAAAVSNSGTVNAAVLNFTVPRGAVGPQGAPGTPGSVTIAGLGDATTISRFVCITASGGVGAADGANTWAKLATLSSGNFNDCQILLAVASSNVYLESATIAVTLRGAADGAVPPASIAMLSKSGAALLSAEAFKLVGNAASGGVASVELWVKKSQTYGRMNVYELSRAITGGSPAITYHATAPWQAAEPVGAVVNVSTNGVTASGVPVVTTTGAQALTGKTISGASNTITNLPASATPDAARLVCTTAAGGSTAENGANTWAKIATIAFTAGARFANLVLALTGGRNNTAYGDYAILGVYAESNLTTPGIANNSSASIMAGAGSTFGTDSLKIISGGYGTPYELWIKKTSSFCQFRVSELSRSLSADFVSVTYHDGAPWQSAVPTGAVTNVSSNGVTAFGQPVVTTTATQTLTGKTLTSPTITNPVIESLNGANGTKALHLNADVGAVNYLQVSGKPAGNPVYVTAAGGDTSISLYANGKGTGKVILGNSDGLGFSVTAAASSVNRVEATGSATGSAPSFAALGSDTNIGLNLVSKGSGTVLANGIPVATTTGAQTITNKTISGASNTITNLPASATPNAARLVRSIGTSLVGQWSRVFTLPTTATAYRRANVILSVTAYNTNMSAIVGIELGTAAASQVTASVTMLAKGPGSLADDAFKVVCNGYGEPLELWFKGHGNGSVLNFFELGSYQHVGIVYDTGSVWQASEPVGTALNASSAGITYGGNPVGVKVAVPATATSTGVVGQWAADASWHYVCTATNTWRRTAVSTW